MFDIRFYQEIYPLKRSLMAQEPHDKAAVLAELDRYRSRCPVVYNIETTNACNMRCVMCPRTTMMTRPIDHMPLELFKKIADQLVPFSKDEWEAWQAFCEKTYGVPRDIASENHFFLHVIPKVLVLHGYGDPLLDRDMLERVKALTARGIPSYFSCNPANILPQKTADILRAGLGYIKFSVESVDDFVHKSIRGLASDFSTSHRKIFDLMEIKKRENLPVTFVITMLDLGRGPQDAEFKKLQAAFQGADAYVYHKSQDQKWYDNSVRETKSLHWTEFCQFPWSSMTIKSNGEAAMCVEDFNNEIILGDARAQTLEEIWNGPKYAEFRRMHLDLRPGIKCTQQCDMRLVGHMNLASPAKP